MEDTHKSQFGRMFTELLARHRAKTSEQSSKRSGKSAKEAIAFLDLRKTDLDGKNGRNGGSSWEIIPLSLGEDLTLNFGESPKDASVCSLFSILEDNVPDRYFLSVTACKGILRRSEDVYKRQAASLLLLQIVREYFKDPVHRAEFEDWYRKKTGEEYVWKKVTDE